MIHPLPAPINRPNTKELPGVLEMVTSPLYIVVMVASLCLSVYFSALAIVGAGFEPKAVGIFLALVTGLLPTVIYLFLCSGLKLGQVSFTLLIALGGVTTLNTCTSHRGMIEATQVVVDQRWLELAGSEQYLGGVTSNVNSICGAEAASEAQAEAALECMEDEETNAINGARQGERYRACRRQRNEALVLAAKLEDPCVQGRRHLQAMEWACEDGEVDGFRFAYTQGVAVTQAIRAEGKAGGTLSQFLVPLASLPAYHRAPPGVPGAFALLAEADLASRLEQRQLEIRADAGRLGVPEDLQIQDRLVDLARPAEIYAALFRAVLADLPAYLAIVLVLVSVWSRDKEAVLLYALGSAILVGYLAHCGSLI